MKKTTKLVYENNYAAEVDVELLYTDDDWSPYLSVDDAQKLDSVRRALRKGDLQFATKLGRIFQMIPATA